MSGLEPISYSHAGVALTGWLARPPETPRAAILLLPTIFNLTAAVQRRASMLADLGYLTLIADFYGTSEGDIQAHARALRSDVDHYRARLSTGLAALQGLPEAAGLKVAAIGYCMGGQAALELARDGHDLFAVTSFHGILTTDRPARAGAMHARILICHGDADPMVPREQVLGFWREMDEAAANWHFHSYSGVKHGFTDPGSDDRGMAALGYDPSADRQSWMAMVNLFDEVLG